MPKASLLAPLMLALLPSALRAEAPVSYDLHAAAVKAMGDFQDAVGKSTGFVGAFSITVPLTPRLSVRPRVSREVFPVERNNYAYKSTRFSDVGIENTKWSAWSFGADCLFRPSGEGGRLYVLAGGFLKAWKVQSYGSYVTQDRVNGTSTYTIDDSTTSNQAAAAMGIGYRFHRHWSVETRVVLASYRKLSYNTWETGMAFHF